MLRLWSGFSLTICQASFDIRRPYLGLDLFHQQLLENKIVVILFLCILVI